MKTAPKLIAAAGLLFLFSAASLAREKVQSLAQIYPQESSQTQSDTTVRQKVEGQEQLEGQVPPQMQQKVEGQVPPQQQVQEPEGVEQSQEPEEPERIQATGREYVAMQREVVATGRDFRTPGYKGSVSLTVLGPLMFGIETSHGKMLDRSNYLGGGLGAYFFGARWLALEGLFVDYAHYARDAQNTFVVGGKLGLLFDLANLYAPGEMFKAPFIEPNIGWNWKLQNGQGITALLGAVVSMPQGDIGVGPMISLSFEF